MIKKIINKYFCNYYKRLINNYLTRWYIDSRFVEKFGQIYLEVKKPHFKEEYYSPIYCWYCDDSLYHIVNYNDSMKIIKINLEEYFKEESDDK